MQYILKTVPVSLKLMRRHSPPEFPSITNYV